jgi:anti-sigma factor RsiW
MIGANEHAPDDPELTAFLDGELSEPRQSEIRRWLESDQDARERLALIERGARPFRAAFDLVLEEAPRARLSAMLAALLASNAPQKRVWRWSPMAATAAGLAIFGLGLTLGHWIPPREGLPMTKVVAGAPENWRQTVAEYFSLQTADTAPDDAQTQGSDLATAATQLGLALSPQRLAFPGLILKRAELYKFKGMPLSEILYIGSNGTPMALCIIANGNPDASFREEQREGLNIVYWQSRGRGFLLIGKTPAPELRLQAETVAQRLTS